MRLIKQAVMAVLTTALLLSLATGMATARVRVEISATAFLAAGRLTFNPDAFLNPSIICDVTLHITASRLINKIRGERIGAITSILTANPRADFGRNITCTPLPGMTISYGSILGTLPTITGVLVLIDARFLFTIEPGDGRTRRCHAESAVGALGNNPIRTMSPLRDRLPITTLPTSEGACPAEGILEGPFTFTPEVTVRLLER